MVEEQSFWLDCCHSILISLLRLLLILGSLEEEELVDAVEGEQVAFASATTEENDIPISSEGGELEVTVRLIDEGALVRWRREPRDSSRCTVRWYEGAAPGERLLATGHTLHDYMLGA